MIYLNINRLFVCMITYQANCQFHLMENFRTIVIL